MNGSAGLGKNLKIDYYCMSCFVDMFMFILIVHINSHCLIEWTLTPTNSMSNEAVEAILM